jgi:hypothetical protein
MLMSNLPSVRRPVEFRALSFTLRILEKAGLMRQPLEMEALLAAARRQTGLDDFGDETFREPLSRLLDSTVRSRQFLLEPRYPLPSRCHL